MLTWLPGFVLAAGGTALVSFLVEALRPSPETPGGLDWDPGIAVRYATVAGLKIRYIQTGQGPPLLLLHTLRTQLDLYQRMVAPLARDFTVIAIDYPGHGWSDIPDSAFRPVDFLGWVSGVLETLDLREVTVVGTSIGANLALLLGAAPDGRVRRVVAINPYDYAGGTGARRANLVARVIFTLAAIPVVGETVMRLRNRMVERVIMEGGVASPDQLPASFVDQVYTSGLRPGHYRGFLSLLRHASEWDDTLQEYGRITVPAMVVYGDRDWSYPDERQRTIAVVPGVRAEVIRDGGHFLPLDQPGRLVELIRSFGRTPVPPAAPSRAGGAG